MSLKKYITESERATAFPVTGDVLEVVVREDFDDEIAIDFPVVEHTDDSITFLSDDYAYGVLEDCNYVGDETDGVIDPPSEELDETTHVTPQGYKSVTNEGTVMERIKDGKIYCPEACCGVKVMDCTCGSKCSHCNCKTIQKLAGDIKMFEEQAALHKRLGAADTANYYNRKLTEAVEQTEKLIEDVEEVEAMITRRIMNHPEFSDMVREYGIEQITQAISDTAEFHGDDDDEIGSSDVSAMVNDTIKSLKRVIENDLAEAEYQGRKVQLNKPMQGDVKKFKVYVKDPKTGNVKKVNFGHGGSSVKGKAMKIRKNNPKARKSFRARHNCDNPGPKTNFLVPANDLASFINCTNPLKPSSWYFCKSLGFINMAAAAIISDTSIPILGAFAIPLFICSGGSEGTRTLDILRDRQAL